MITFKLQKDERSKGYYLCRIDEKGITQRMYLSIQDLKILYQIIKTLILYKFNLYSLSSRN